MRRGTELSASPSSRHRIGWLVAEFVVIVLGVLTALAAEEWRQGRQDLQLEVGYLQRLQENLSMDTTVYARAILRNEASRDILRGFLDVVDGDAQLPADPMAWVAGFNGSLTADFEGPRRDTYDELINQGDLGRIRSPALRALLTEYYGERETYHETQILEWQQDARRVEALLIERLPADAYRWVQGTAMPSGIADPELVDFTLTQAQVMALLAQVREDAEISNQLFRHAQILTRMASIHAQWSQQATALMRTLDAELARRVGG